MYLLTTIAIIFIVLHTYNNVRIPANYSKTTGIVKSNVWFYADSRSAYKRYSPEIKFDVGPRQYIFIGNISNDNTPTYQVGDSIPVAYNPLNPSDHPKMNIKTVDYIKIKILIVFAIICLFASIFNFRKGLTIRL